MDKDVRFYTEKNLDSWDEAASVHASAFPDLEKRVAQPGFDNLNPDFAKLVNEACTAHKDVLQLCCNNGLDLLSIKRRGAGRCVGIDGSKAFIGQAKKLAKAAGEQDIHYFCHNIYQLPPQLNSTFDCLVITVGVINWMPDLAHFFTICQALLKPGGTLLMEEIHPVLNMYQEGEPSVIDASYFEKTPFCDTQGLDYFNHQKYQAKENYWFTHTMGDILNAAIGAGLTLQYIEELGKNIGNYCEDLADSPYTPPMAFVARWQRV
ncbi:MAG: class I SAM-dependent methyltransferase [Pseudomonadales bacterium]